MTRIRAFFRWLLGKSVSAGDPLGEALERFRQPEANTLELLRRLVAVLRPAHRHDAGSSQRYTAMLDRLLADPDLRAAFCRHVVHFIATRRLITFFTDSGILPGTGFFSEWGRILGNRLLPEVPDERRLKDCLHVIFNRSDDWRWLQEMPADQAQRFWELIAPEQVLGNIDWRNIQEQMLDSVLLLAHRVSGLGIESELMRASPNFDDDRPRFIGLSSEALEFVNAFRAALDDPARQADDGSQLLVIADQCRETLQKTRKRALTVGTSLHLSYLLTRSEQSLERLRDLIAILVAACCGGSVRRIRGCRRTFRSSRRRPVRRASPPATARPPRPRRPARPCWCRPRNRPARGCVRAPPAHRCARRRAPRPRRGRGRRAAARHRPPGPGRPMRAR